MKKCLLIITVLFTPSITLSSSFEKNWLDMQKKYKKLISELHKKKIIKSEKELLHPEWKKCQKTLKKIVLGSPDKKIWLKYPLNYQMVRTGWGKTQRYEVNFLKSSLEREIFELINSYQDTSFIETPFTCKEFNCSTNTLGHLYYASLTLEKQRIINKPIKKIIEFGGGYGNLARIFKKLLPETTIVIIDIPEMLAIQYLFLRSTVSTDIIFHSTPPNSIKNNAIHLIPVDFLENIHFDTDIFISTFGLSETPNNVQKKISIKKFFNAELLYLVGQLDNKCSVKWEDHNFLLIEAKKLYNNLQFTPYNPEGGEIRCYEMLGYKNI